MGVLDAVGKAFTQKASGFSGLQVGPANAGVPMSTTDDPRKQLAHFKGWVYAAASLRARAVASVPGKLMAGEDEIDAHPFLELWERPNDAWHGFAWRQVVYLHLYLSGNSFNYIARDRLGVIRQLIPMSPGAVRVIPGKTRFIDGYELGLEGQHITLAPEEVWHLKLPNPNSPYYGMGVVQAAAQAIDISDYIHDYGLATFRNHSIPAAWIKMSPDTPAGERRKVRQMIEQSFKGVANGNRTLISGDAIESITPLSLSPADLDFLNGAHFSRDEIFALFGVHRAMVGMADDINRANAQAGEYTFAKWIVTADLQVMTDGLNSEILPFYDERLEWEPDNPVPEDTAVELDKATKGWSTGAVTRDEWRRTTGYDDAPVGGDVYAIPFSVTIVPADQDPTAVDGTEQQALPDTIVPTDPQEPDPSTQGGDTAPKQLTKGLAEKRAKARGQADRYIGPAEAKLTEAMRGYFAEQGRRVQGRVRNGSRAYAQGETLKDAIDTPAERQRLHAFLASFLSAAFLQGLRYVANTAGVDVPGGDGEIQHDGQALITQRGQFSSEKITATTEAAVSALIAEHQASGSSIAELVSAIGDLFAGFAGGRSQVVGRQESSTMFHEATTYAMGRTGLSYKAWITAGDDAVEETCAGNEADGVIEIGETFSSGDMEPPTDEHYNCRCVLLPLTAQDAGEEVA